MEDKLHSLSSAQQHQKQAKQTISTRSLLKLYSIIPLFLQQPLLVNETYLSSIKSVQNILIENILFYFFKKY